MHISILTLFPKMFTGPFQHSIIHRAIAKNKASISFINLRDFAKDAYHSVDDRPFGGGVGMILCVDIVDRALQKPLKANHERPKTRIVLLDPGGIPYTQKKARELAGVDHLILICGHYEGVDDRIRHLVDEEISIGDYVLSGGEIPAMVITDSVIRLLPGVLNQNIATERESFETSILEYPQFTKPRCYKRMKVPSVLLSGNHAKIAQWQTRESFVRTQKNRPDLLKPEGHPLINKKKGRSS